MLQLDDTDRLVMTVTNIREGELKGLEAGDELYINCACRHCAAMSVAGWLFCPIWLPRAEPAQQQQERANLRPLT